MDYFVHPQGICESAEVGTGTRIWAFAHVLPGARIGRDCNICDHTFVEGNVVVGDRVTIKSGVQLWSGVRLEDDVFVGPNVTFTNDPYPRSRQYLAAHPETLVRRGASIGANATILPGITIGQNAMIGAGSVVVKSVPPNAVVVGNPARIVRYVSGEHRAASVDPAERLPVAAPGVVATNVRGVTLHRTLVAQDMRGTLTVGDIADTIPFAPKRYFMVFDVPSAEVRGEHAHRRCHQFLMCTAGRCSVLADDGVNRQEFVLDAPSLGLHLPPMTWGTQYKYTRDATLFVFASEPYDPGDYIRDYEGFLAEANRDVTS